MKLPRVRSTSEPHGTLNDLLKPPPTVELLGPYGNPVPPEFRQHYADGITAAFTTEREPFNLAALAEVQRELASLRADSDAREQLVAAVDTVIRPAIAEATAAGVGVLIAYGPAEVVARPSVAVKRGEALLLRTDRATALTSTAPITFEGANA